MWGFRFKEYVYKRKLSCAADEIIHTECRIIEIAMQFGFSSQEVLQDPLKSNMDVPLINTENENPTYQHSKEYIWKNNTPLNLRERCFYEIG